MEPERYLPSRPPLICALRTTGKAAVADRGLGRLNWADSRPPGVAKRIAGIPPRPGIGRYGYRLISALIRRSRHARCWARGVRAGAVARHSLSRAWPSLPRGRLRGPRRDRTRARRAKVPSSAQGLPILHTAPARTCVAERRVSAGAVLTGGRIIRPICPKHLDRPPHVVGPTLRRG